MNFTHYLTEQLHAHPSIQPRDIVKQCYQAAYGAEHLLSDPERARRYLAHELQSTVASAHIPLCERISDHVCRINLAAWKHRSLPVEWLFRMFAATINVSVTEDAAGMFLAYLEEADHWIRHSHEPFTFSVTDWDTFLAEYKKNGISAVHHSDTYREKEHPAYRIIRHDLTRLLPILEAANDLICQSAGTARLAADMTAATGKFPCIIAIDGRAASGKTTMAGQLAQILDADIVQMDDFFLPPSLRTADRLQSPGGNVHYERFAEEVLPYLREPHPFAYRCFDCHIMDYNGERMIGHIRTSCDASGDAAPRQSAAFRIVEGSYSCHPYFGDYADISVFSTIDPEEQMQRILHRNGPQMAEVFRTRWIPMEEQYIQAFQINEKTLQL